jgi:hypothetical protein
MCLTILVVHLYLNIVIFSNRFLIDDNSICLSLGSRNILLRFIRFLINI